ncbi:hypothetical protein SAMN04489712_11542 [Thermomonospora echinospora]|uniref:Thioesterase-like superfamily protein n=1 Tax=Thermomonospora echinospora TaxID=1992 RepID=A0A1H6DBD3_9ACTN|nr:hypothetical protein [Thermomonospora echinospora]SEG82549.1 hypothetical protein SAMN04489712_11542 [Thermomonospora echinospora]
MDSLIIPRRFNGPPDSGNGGYAAGRLAAGHGQDALRDGVTVILRNPLPLDTPLSVSPDAVRLRLYDGERLLAEALPGRVEASPIPAVSHETAVAATAGYPGRDNDNGTPFAYCFVCGPGRPDGLRLAPGPVAADTVAAPWTPDASLAPDPALIWAVLDCPGGWSGDLLARPALLGTMTARVLDLPEIGEPCVVLGRLLRRDGRKMFATTTLYGQDGRLLAQADQTWIEFTLP